mmetsp:Transcript_13425/g.34120  ORF Transcript_13425/g.34120 Transcript_13425/m.34120 type:complete len:100 (+) Transcript_13425:386-685(+)
MAKFIFEKFGDRRRSKDFGGSSFGLKLDVSKVCKLQRFKNTTSPGRKTWVLMIEHLRNLRASLRKDESFHFWGLETVKFLALPLSWLKIRLDASMKRTS